jgi:hypothetical protein
MLLRNVGELLPGYTVLLLECSAPPLKAVTGSRHSSQPNVGVTSDNMYPVTVGTDRSLPPLQKLSRILHTPS